MASVALEKLSFESVNGQMDGRMDGRTDGRMHDGQKVTTIAHPEHSSGELKRGIREAFPSNYFEIGPLA